MADEEVRKIEITYPTAFASAAKAGGARVLAMMTAAGADSQSSTKFLRNIGDKEKKSEELTFDFLGLYRPAVILGNSNTPSALDSSERLMVYAENTIPGEIDSNRLGSDSQTAAGR